VPAVLHVTVLTLKQNITLINNQYLGDVKCALNMEESKLNNFFSSSLSLFRVADLKLTTFSLEREYSLGKRMLKTPCIMHNV